MALLLKYIDPSQYFHLLYKTPEYDPLLDIVLSLGVGVGERLLAIYVL